MFSFSRNTQAVWERFAARYASSAKTAGTHMAACSVASKFPLRGLREPCGRPHKRSVIHPRRQKRSRRQDAVQVPNQKKYTRKGKRRAAKRFYSLIHSKNTAKQKATVLRAQPPVPAVIYTPSKDTNHNRNSNPIMMQAFCRRYRIFRNFRLTNLQRCAIITKHLKFRRSGGLCAASFGRAPVSGCGAVGSARGLGP